MFIGLFAAGLFDQTLLPEVSAALVDTGRIRFAPWGRAMRSAASDQIVFHGEESDRQAEMERLKLLHRDVKGVSADGIRYSALNPESWNWILISTFFVYRGAFVAITGEKLCAADNQALWDRVRNQFEGLQLPGRSRLIENYDQLCAYYDRMVTDKLQATATTADAFQTLRRPPRPPFLPAATEPAWRMARPVAGHVAEVLGYGIMHPGARALLPMRWTRRHDFEFAALTTVLRMAYRHLPTWATDTPLARNRRQYQRLTNSYRSIGLTSFAPDARTSA
ncbi:oxygenase MpaB family protein [Nocardia otitidiscaviarum]|uniref:oxygenase MpaB family protein n=1 Tax=Nocardia otitidiscaviarum TaxID=1823 RepID=UPI002B4ADA86|nr:oxygenase MpaB family protein [Nocardia otitidiscaviarum]